MCLLWLSLVCVVHAVSKFVLILGGDLSWGGSRSRKSHFPCIKSWARWQVAGSLQLHTLNRLNSFIPSVCTCTYLSLLTVWQTMSSTGPCYSGFLTNQVTNVGYVSDTDIIDTDIIDTNMLCLRSVVIVNVGLAQAQIFVLLWLINV